MLDLGAPAENFLGPPLGARIAQGTVAGCASRKFSCLKRELGGRDRAPSVQLESTSWTAAGQGPLSLEFSRQEYWSALPILRHSPQTFASLLPVAETLPDQPVLCRGGYHGQGPQEMLDHLK